MSRAQVRWVDDSWCVVTRLQDTRFNGRKRRVPGFWRKRYVWPMPDYQLAKQTADWLNQD